MSGEKLKYILTRLEHYKIHHIVFWAIYHFAWWTVYIGNTADVIATFSLPHAVIKYLGYVIFQAIGIYFTLYVLIPKYLEQLKYLKFFLSVIGVIALMTLCVTGNYYVAASFSGVSPYDLFNISPPSVITIFKKNAMPSCISAMTLGMSIKLAKNWLEAQKHQRILEKEKLETELKFLKSQFNPHFLFNTINSIFVLIDKNPEMASESLVKFSSLLRYQLYECNSNMIPLRNELAYIESFIELESLRQNKNFELELNLPKSIDQEFRIAPFILIPFIENAFKHIADDANKKKWVHLNIKIKNNVMHFKLGNTTNFDIKHKDANTISYGGLGLKNVRRRLDILYPNAHALIIKKAQDIYIVKLKLELDYVIEEMPLKKVSG
ncbi:sensor histidine kinase [Winogradskyella flava]|uniref:sensor histidine kinase n=1 Tax=Winogradskyella flava TaxID=1884876 RepID=UPI0024914923|nr:histidine kinase [Winogradskyella flava]